MKYANERIYSKQNYNTNGSKNPKHWSKNAFVSTTEEPGINKSGIEAEKRGF